MKKTILVMFILVTCLALAAVAGAATTIGSAGTTIGGSTFIPSTNVTISALSIPTSYCATAQNSSSDTTKGGKQYASTSGSSTLVVGTATSTGVPTNCTSTTATPF